jgi:4-amino-4-deoxychorismate lyase
MKNLVIVNGEISDSISVYDRGLAYGDGVFETVLANNGKCLLWDRHLERLKKSLEQLQIATDELNNLYPVLKPYLPPEAEQVVKIIVTRGNSQRGYAVEADSTPNTLIYITEKPKPVQDWAKIGARAVFCKTRLAYQPSLAGLKHLNRLEQILARLELTGHDLQEGIMRGQQGEVVEGIMHNLFFVKNSELFTPDLSQCGVAGIMRTFIIENCQQLGLPLHIGEVSVEQLLAADEIFLSNSINVIWPICELDGTRFEIGTVTSQLQDMVVEKMYRYG